MQTFLLCYFVSVTSVIIIIFEQTSGQGMYISKYLYSITMLIKAVCHCLSVLVTRFSNGGFKAIWNSKNRIVYLLYYWKNYMLELTEHDRVLMSKCYSFIGTIPSEP